MRLSRLIGEIGAKYDRQLPMSSKAHRLLRQAEDEFKQWVPAGYLVEGGGGKGKPAITPAIAIMNPGETTTTRHGMYVLYLFAADKSTVTLTLNQGVTEMAQHLGRAGARMVLAMQASAIRAALDSAEIADLELTFDLRTTAPSSEDYEHANIVSRTYNVDSLPSESEMVADLHLFLRLYTLALEARELARRHGRHELITRPRRITVTKMPAEPEAKPLPVPVPAPVPIKLAEPEAAAPPPETPSVAEVAEEPDAPDALKPEIIVERKNKLLTGSMTRRGVLAALIAVPIAYAAPKAAGGRHRAAMAPAPSPVPPPVVTAPMFTVDVSQHDWKRRGGNLDWAAIRRAGIAGMCARATYGDPSGYQWPTHHFGSFSRAAKAAGMGIRGGYHNLVKGDQASINRQVDWLRRELDRYNANWAMLDVERYGELVKSDMWPRWDDVRRFDDRWAQVESRVLVGYIPPWNWSKHLGQPDLREYRGPLIASNYPRQANEDYKELYQKIGGDSGRGWANYGNRTPDGWQYTSRAKVPGASHLCDVNAWRVSFDDLKTLLSGTAK